MSARKDNNSEDGSPKLTAKDKALSLRALPPNIGDGAKVVAKGQLYRGDSLTAESKDQPNASGASKTSKKKKKKTRARPTAEGIKASRGVDTLLRNAYRAQLDMLALAATKANIMISLNGLLISILIISSTHLISINGLYLVPVGIFMLTCAMAITFAVFAARPSISRKKHDYQEFASDDAHLLSFEEFSDLKEPEYVGAMYEMLQDSDRVYKNMIAHVHELGVEADRKYRFLYYSYTAFMAGTIITVLTILALLVLKWMGLFVLM
ncbi:MAG: Pycsar system effector family protein [Granulosicoccus sp.]